jgi:hypothetical protein
MGQAEKVDSFALHVRGGDLVIGLIADLLDHLKVGALDPTPPLASFSVTRPWDASDDGAHTVVRLSAASPSKKFVRHLLEDHRPPTLRIFDRIRIDVSQSFT